MTIIEMLEWFDRDHPNPGEDHAGDIQRASRDLIAKGLVIYDPFTRHTTRDGGTQGILSLARRLH